MSELAYHSLSSNMQQNYDYTQPCAVCGRPTIFWCSQCQAEWYCSKIHNTEGWPRHKQKCQPVRPLPPSSYLWIAIPPPDNVLSETVSALYFGINDVHPSLIQVNCPELSSTFRYPQPVAELLKIFKNEPVNAIILLHGLNGEPLRFPLQIWYAPRLLHNGAPINQSVAHITSSAGVKQWAGPVVVLKFKGSRLKGYADASALDLPALSSYFLAYK